MKVLLAFPPQWTAAQPHFGVASLNGQLRRAGHEVVVRDLNLELIEHVLTGDAQALASKRLVGEARLLTAELASHALARNTLELQVTEQRLRGLERYVDRHGGRRQELCEVAEAIGPELRDPAGFFEPRRYLSAVTALDAALEAYSAPSWPTALKWNDFRHPTVPLDLEPLEAMADDRRLNPCVRFFERKLGGLLDAGAGLIAISISASSQVVPGLTLASMLRRELARVAPERRPHLALGGNFFSRLRDALLELPGFFAAFCDSLCLGEGERTLVELVGALDRRRPLGSVPNLLHLEGGVVKATGTAPNLPMAELAMQELDGLPLERYLAPERVVCLRASKGCYWGQCSFCDSYYGLEPDSVAVDRVVAEMAHLKARYGVRHFEFVDQCIAPAYLSKLADALLAANLEVRWFCNARTEPGFTRELLDRVHRAGNTMIMWGLESGSPRLLKLMKKGVQAEHRLEILADSAAAGIFNFGYVFFGFPSETREEAQATIDLICDHTAVIHGYGRSVFTLGRHSPLASDPKRYGVLEVVEDAQQLSTNLTYQVAAGLGPADLGEISSECAAQCREAYGGDPLWMALRSREALHLYLAHHGREFVRRWRPADRHPPLEAEFTF